MNNHRNPTTASTYQRAMDRTLDLAVRTLQDRVDHRHADVDDDWGHGFQAGLQDAVDTLRQLRDA